VRSNGKGEEGVERLNKNLKKNSGKMIKSTDDSKN